MRRRRFTVVQLEDELISHQWVGVVLAREDDDEGSVVVFDGQSLNRVPAPGYSALVMAELGEDVAGESIAGPIGLLPLLPASARAGRVTFSPSARTS